MASRRLDSTLFSDDVCWSCRVQRYAGLPTIGRSKKKKKRTGVERIEQLAERKRAAFLYAIEKRTRADASNHSILAAIPVCTRAETLVYRIQKVRVFRRQQLDLQRDKQCRDARSCEERMRRRSSSMPLVAAPSKWIHAVVAHIRTAFCACRRNATTRSMRNECK